MSAWILGLSCKPVHARVDSPAYAQQSDVRPASYPPVVARPGCAVDAHLEVALREEYQALTRRLGERRERIASLTRLVGALEHQADEDERLVREVAGLLGEAPQLRIDELDPRLSGQRLIEVATELLRRRDDPTTPVHYRDWFELVRRRGYHVAGKDPLANFLAHVNRAPEVESVGRRTGLYRLRAVV